MLKLTHKSESEEVPEMARIGCSRAAPATVSLGRKADFSADYDRYSLRNGRCGQGLGMTGFDPGCVKTNLEAQNHVD